MTLKSMLHMHKGGDADAAATPIRNRQEARLTALLEDYKASFRKEWETEKRGSHDTNYYWRVARDARREADQLALEGKSENYAAAIDGKQVAMLGSREAFIKASALYSVQAGIFSEYGFKDLAQNATLLAEICLENALDPKGLYRRD